ncbi:MAG: hypothetical protein FWF05_05580 [Oscillospiraceae bacterium]|nr:hypothetical protein [Oscillospiraceae bacterium]
MTTNNSPSVNQGKGSVCIYSNNGEISHLTVSPKKKSDVLIGAAAVLVTLSAIANIVIAVMNCCPAQECLSQESE